MCVYGHAEHPDSSGVADPTGFTDSLCFADTAPVDRAGGGSPRLEAMK
jgi:hypothetical protein